jgi:hypothetical protein
MIFGEVINQGDDNTPKETAAVVSVPFHDMNVYLDEETMEQRAGCSLDGLFRPFSTNYAAEKIPHFIDIGGLQDNLPNARTLNPFTDGDIGVMIHGKKGEKVDYNNNLLEDKPIVSDDIRPIGLRAPLILVGFGYDVNGKPVPNKTPDSPGDEFADNYKKEQTKHKAGPLDVKWNEEKGVWEAGSSSSAELFAFKCIEAGGLHRNNRSGYCNIFEPKSYANGDIVIVDESGLVIDSIGMFTDMRSGDRGLAMKRGNDYFVIQAPC